MELSKDLNPFVRITRITFAEICAHRKTNQAKSSAPDHTKIALIKSRGRTKFQCYFCKKILNSSGYLKIHLSLHTKEEPYKCSVCKSRFTRSSKLNQHIRIIHNKQKYSCPICPRKLISKWGYQVHLKIHDKLSEKCPFCEKTYFSKSSLKQHIHTAHNVKAHQCHICHQSFSYNSGLQTHIDTVHRKTRNHLCSFCSKGFGSRNQLNAHMNAIHFGQKDLVKCPEPGCDLTFNTRTTAWRHRLKCHPKEGEVDKLKCNICHRIFSSVSNLRTHEKSVHSSSIPSVQCPLCQKTYSQTGRLREHITSKHTAEKSFRCDRFGCSEEFALQAQLHAHKKHHLDRELGRKYPCDKCVLVFKHDVTLRRHRRRDHLRNKSFQCYFCPSECKSDFELIAHFRIHTKEKPFKSPTCRVEYSSAWNLTRHNKSKH